MKSAAYEQLDAFTGGTIIVDRAVLPKFRLRAIGATPTPIPVSAMTRAQFVQRTVKEHYDAMRSEASCRSTSKHETLTEDERSHLRDQADRHRARAERALAALTLHSVYPQVP